MTKKRQAVEQALGNMGRITTRDTTLYVSFISRHCVKAASTFGLLGIKEGGHRPIACAFADFGMAPFAISIVCNFPD